jgi:hypothetical protein
MSGGNKEDFSNFKIGSMPGFGPGGSTPRPAAPAAPVASSASSTRQLPDPPEESYFPNLEALIEQDNEALQAFAASMGETCEALDELIAKRSGRIKQEAQNARQAYEHTFSLIDYLLEVKAILLSTDDEEENS